MKASFRFQVSGSRSQEEAESYRLEVEARDLKPET
jgi:hypothetical protein